MLSRVDRLALILRIVEYLRSDPDRLWNQVDFVLDRLGFDTSDGWIEDKIGGGTDEQVCELAQVYGVDLPPGAVVVTPSTTTTTTVAAAEPLFIFASHLTTHKVLVGDVSRALAAYGIDLFVAHDTITHDAAWEDEIRDALDRADAGLVFVHDGLKDSPWCDQEIGWLQGRHVPVMALKFNATPYGFFAKYQAQQIPSGATAEQIAEMTVERIAARPALASALAASLVASLKLTNNFDDTRARFRYVRDLSRLDARLCAQLLDAAKTNTQVYWANSPWDGDDGQNISRLIIAFLRNQPGGSTIGPDIDAYEAYLDAREASGAGFYTTHTPPLATVTV